MEIWISVFLGWQTCPKIWSKILSVLRSHMNVHIREMWCYDPVNAMAILQIFTLIYPEIISM